MELNPNFPVVTKGTWELGKHPEFTPEAVAWYAHLTDSGTTDGNIQIETDGTYKYVYRQWTDTVSAQAFVDAATAFGGDGFVSIEIVQL